MSKQTVRQQDFQPTEKPKMFNLGNDSIVVEVENSLRGLYWRMTVNGSPSPVSHYYEGILVHKGYGLTTAYYDGDFKPFVPFKITFAKEKEQ